MNKEKMIDIAARYLNNRGVDFIGPVEFGRKEGKVQEVIFWEPQTLEPGVVVDPPDIVVLVNVDTGEADLKIQM